jgi:hypothetical protein
METTTQKPDPLDEARASLLLMKKASEVFYSMAVRVNHHQFVEFTGFMNEYIKACERAVRDGKDFRVMDIPFKGYEMEYIAEKFDCIFGEVLLNRDTRQSFFKGLAKKGGWPVPRAG